MSGPDDGILPLGRFHELSLSTRDLAASVDFWRGEGWDPVPVRPVWSHPYAAMARGGVVLGLHQHRFPSPSVTCVHADIAAALEAHRDAGMAIAFAKTGPDSFKEFGFRDPHGHMVTLLEAPTHDAPIHDTPACGGAPAAPPGGGEVFLSLPAEDAGLAMRFWAVLGATEAGTPPGGWPCRRLLAGGLPLAFHASRPGDRPALVCASSRREDARRIRETPEGLAWACVSA